MRLKSTQMPPRVRREVALEAGAAAVADDGDAADVADLHDGRDVGGGGGVDDAEGLLGRVRLVRGPVRRGVLAEHVLDGADVVAADDLDKVGPGGLGLAWPRLCPLGGRVVARREG